MPNRSHTGEELDVVEDCCILVVVNIYRPSQGLALRARHVFDNQMIVDVKSDLSVFRLGLSGIKDSNNQDE